MPEINRTLIPLDTVNRFAAVGAHHMCRSVEAGRFSPIMAALANVRCPDVGQSLAEWPLARRSRQHLTPAEIDRLIAAAA